MVVVLMKVVDVDFQNTVIPYFHRPPLKRKTKHMALDGMLNVQKPCSMVLVS
jgi:hypothetical protein